jgi:uncharacterized damage-inducible protein DinB
LPIDINQIMSHNGMIAPLYDLKRAYDYYHLMNLRYIHTYLAKYPEIRHEGAENGLSHIIWVHGLWLHRLGFGNFPEKHYRDITPLEWEPLHLNYMKQQQKIWDANLPATQIVEFKSTQGVAYTSNVGDCLYGMVNHATYHRGQIALAFKELGLKVPISDYAMFDFENGFQS